MSCSKIRKKGKVFCIFARMTDLSILPEKIEAVFFDMDGVLYDSMPNHAYSWSGSFKSEGIDFPEYEAYLNEGATGPYTINKVYNQHFGRNATEVEIKRVYNKKTELMNDAPQAPILPGMKEVLWLTMEAGLKVVVVTGSKQPSLIQRLNSDFGIVRENVVSGFDVVNGKPDAEPYLRALAKAGTSPSNSIVIENAPLGVRAARAANLITVAVNTGILKPEDLAGVGASIVLGGTQQLASIWPEILKRGRM